MSSPRVQCSALSVVERAVGGTLAALLLLSSLAHLDNPYYFLNTVYSYRLTSQTLGQYLALAIPSFQVTVGVCLLFSWWSLHDYYVAALGFIVFLGAQLTVALRGMTVSCGCFGAGGELRVGPASLSLCAAGFAGALVGICLVLRKERASNFEPEP